MNGIIAAMPLPPLNVTLSDWQKREALKRLRDQYADELKSLDVTLTELLTRAQEAELLTQYVGEQPEVKALRPDATDMASKNQRRTYLGQILDRLDTVVRDLPEIKGPQLNGTDSATKLGGLKRY